MYAYVDEFGNITTVPPDQREKPTEEEIQRRLNPVSVDEYSFGKVSYYNAQGHYGFIRDNLTKQTVYFNDRLVGKTLQIDQRVKFKLVRSAHAIQATDVAAVHLPVRARHAGPAPDGACSEKAGKLNLPQIGSLRVRTEPAPC